MPTRIAAILRQILESLDGFADLRTATINEGREHRRCPSSISILFPTYCARKVKRVVSIKGSPGLTTMDGKFG